jgi:DNA repair exonuclease SbcCD ATPase subunit
VKLRTLTLRNFGSFRGEHEIPLAQQGLVSILGRNEVDLGESANGAGKSTIVDALLWGLFGETGPRKESTSSDGGLKTDDVVNEIAGKDCLVTVDFEHASSAAAYRVERWRKAGKDRPKTNGVRLLSGDTIVADLDAPNVQQQIDLALGLDHKLACQVLVRSQEDAYNFCQATPKERFEILTRIEGLDAFDAIEEIIRAKSRELLSTIAGETGRLAGMRSTLEILQSEGDLAAQIDGWERERSARVADLQQRIGEFEADRLARSTPLAERPALRAQLAEIDAQAQMVAAPAEPPQLDQWRTHLTAVTADGARARTRYDAAQGALGKIRPGLCAECGQTVSDEHVAAHRAALEHERAQAQSVGVAANQAVEESRRAIAEIQTAHQGHARQVQAARDQVARARAEVQGRLAALDAVERSLTDTRPLENMKRDIERAAVEENPYRSRFTETTARIRAVMSSLGDLEHALGARQTEAGLLDWWLRGIPTMKAWIFDNVVGLLTVEANRWLTTLMGGSCWVQIDSTTTTKEGESRDKIGLRCFRWLPDGGFVERPFRRWSGGEKRRIALAVDWALSSRLSQRAHARCSFIALDEVDRHLDDAGRAGLFAALKELQKEKETVLIVSHDAEMRMASSKRWTVVKDKNGSRIEVADGTTEEKREAPEEARRALDADRSHVQPRGRATGDGRRRRAVQSSG